VATLVDTNILVYCYDPREPSKREAAREVVRLGSAANQIILAHQVLVEFVSVVTASRATRPAFLPREEARRQAEDFLNEFPVLYPNEAVFRMALMGMAAYQFQWYDAHLWAYAEHYGVPELLSEDFEHGRRYGTVRVRNPFVELGLA